MNSGIFYQDLSELKIGDFIEVNSPGRERGFITFEDGAYCFRLPNTKMFCKAVTIRDLMAQAKSAGIKLELKKINQ